MQGESKSFHAGTPCISNTKLWICAIQYLSALCAVHMTPCAFENGRLERQDPATSRNVDRDVERRSGPVGPGVTQSDRRDQRSRHGIRESTNKGGKWQSPCKPCGMAMFASSFFILSECPSGFSRSRHPEWPELEPCLPFFASWWKGTQSPAAKP